MRLFKRRSEDPSPELVSATKTDSDDVGSRELMPAPALPDSSSSFSARKGISTWGRKLGKRFDQLKRSESSELLPGSGRRRHWSPNKNCGDVSNEKGLSSSASPEHPKPKRVSRVESLRNFLRGSEKNESKAKNVTIEEEDISHYKMEKSFSEGVLKNLPRTPDCESNLETLRRKKEILTLSLQNLQKRVPELDRLEMEITWRFLSPHSSKDLNKVSVQHNNFKRNLFNAQDVTCDVNANENINSNNDKSERLKLVLATGMEDLLNNLKLGCDESGYDSDSTRAGADSPDSGKSVVQPMLSPRKFSITSEDYQGVDLSSGISTPKKLEASGTEESLKDEDTTVVVDDVSVVEEDTLSTSATTTTTLIAPNNNTVNFEENAFMNESAFQFNSDADNLPKSKILPNPNSKTQPVCRTPMKKPPPKQEKPSRISKLRDLEVEFKTLKGCKIRKNLCLTNLLENAASPCRDTPPSMKYFPDMEADPIPYYNPKRSRSDMESEVPDTVILQRRKVKRPGLSNSPSKMAPLVSSVKTLVRRELKTMKLFVEVQGNLGICVERKEAVRPFYIISKMDSNGEAAKSNQFRVGDEIVRVCGRRIRGMSEVEARNALRSCFGHVELQIAREPTFAFGGEFGETWGENIISRTKSNSDVWSLKNSDEEKSLDVSMTLDSSNKTSLEDSSCNIKMEESNFLKNEDTPKENGTVKKIETAVKYMDEDECMSCQIVGALTKDGKRVSLSTMNKIEKSDHEVPQDNRRITGMKKFHVVRKRNSKKMRATSLPMDLLTIYLEKGSTKKLGFTIVGGSDSNKGSMGIFVKDIMPGGQAAEEGTLRVGDEIRAINGIPMEGLTHAKALQTFKAAKAGKMILHVGRRDPTHKRLERQ